MTDPGLPNLVSLLPRHPAFDGVAQLLHDAGLGVRSSSEVSLLAVRRRARHGRCQLLFVTNDDAGRAALGDHQLRSQMRVIVVLPEQPEPTEREAVRRSYLDQGAYVVVVAAEVTPAVLECVVDAFKASRTVTVSAPASAPRPRPIAMTMSGRGTMSALNVARELLLASLRHVIAAPQGSAPFTLFVLQLSHYREISDRLLTEGTAKLLQAATARLHESVGVQDMVSYLGDGRYAVLAMGQFDGMLAERLRQAWAAPFEAANESLHLEVSMGMTQGTRRYECPEDVIRDGIIATRRAETNQAPAVFHTSMRIEEADEMRLEAELRQAVKDRAFSLNYQPIVMIDSGEPIGFEALVRWTSPTRGSVSPAQFIPVLERTDLILELGAWILNEAAGQAAQWSAEFGIGSRLFMSVNVSAKQLRQVELVQHVKTTVEGTGIDPRALKLEFTETATIDKPDEVADVLRQCKAQGVDVWVDDFGTGYSSLAHLRRFPVDGVKLDKEFVDPLDGTPQGSTMARAVLGVASVIESAVVAEGIETQAQARELSELGCRWGQGYFFSRPLSLADAYAYIAKSGVTD